MSPWHGGGPAGGSACLLGGGQGGLWAEAGRHLPHYQLLLDWGLGTARWVYMKKGGSEPLPTLERLALQPAFAFPSHCWHTMLTRLPPPAPFQGGAGRECADFWVNRGWGGSILEPSGKGSEAHRDQPGAAAAVVSRASYSLPPRWSFRCYQGSWSPFGRGSQFRL